MSFKPYTTAQLRWYRAVHLTVVSTLREKEKAMKVNSPEALHLTWRVGFNLYLASEYAEALPFLEKVSDVDVYFGEDQNINSYIHQTTGRCAVQLFHQNQKHVFLEKAYIHYQNAVETMVINLYTMFKLPLLLLEFGRVLEHYGAFEAANDLYTRILGNFPNFRGYFDALYRSAIVGRHLASLLSETASKDEAMNKCLDVLQFLLEALPSNISDYQIVLLYGRTLELSTNPQIKFRAHSIYRSLFELCQNHYIAGATKTKDAAEWLDDPQSWFLLGQEIEHSGEPLVAKDAYEKFMELKQKQAAMSYKFENKEVSAHLDVASCLKLALSCARYQNYEEAIRYGELGLKVDRYHKELRGYMSQWSEMHAEALRGEVGAVRSILSVWKGRCWTNGFRKKLKQKMIADNEERYALNRFDWEARENLAYYAKDKYRAKFVFEEFCAVRLQRFARERKKHGIWQDAQRQHQFTLASEVVRRYQRFPLVAAVRTELVAISKHRMVPRNHPIHEAREEILRQDRAVRCFDRMMHTCRIRRALAVKINETKKKRAMKIYLAARTIQCGVRRMLALVTVEAMYARRERCAQAAIVVQRWIRRLNRSMYVSVLKVREFQLQQKRNAREFLRVKLPAMIKAFLVARKMRSKLDQSREAEAKDRAYHAEQRKRIEKASKMIQNFQKLKHRKFLSKLSKEAIQRRKEANLSVTSTELVMHAMIDKTTHYQIPGINQKNAQFVRATQQKVVYCAGEKKFSPADCLMLSMVLRSPACAVKSLILHDLEDVQNPCYEFDLLGALRKCVSIRAVYILGGDWEHSFLEGLVKAAHVENPRITTLVIEQIRRGGSFIDPLSLSVGRLLMDYFNYSIPGICELTVHGCNMGDSNLELICAGIAVNSSIKSLTLSLNLIEDAGFAKVFKAFVGNRKSKIEKLDFSYNLIQCNREIKKLLLEYTPHDPKYFLVVNLMYNRIYEFYHPVNDLVQRGLRASTLSLIYTTEDLIALAHPNHHLSSRDTAPAPTGDASANATAHVTAAVGTSKLRMLRKLHSASTASNLSHDSSTHSVLSKSSSNHSMSTSASARKLIGGH